MYLDNKCILNVYNKCILKKDLARFSRKNKIKAFFQNKNEEKDETELANKEPSMKSKINWEPKMIYHNNERFIETVNKAVVERFSEENKLSKN